MGDRTGIQWTDATWSPTRGCSRVSEGCRHCYAERVAARFSGDGQPFAAYSIHGKWTGRVDLVPAMLDQPLRWRRPRRIFVNSMSDLFHEGLADDEIDRVFAVMALAQRHTFQVLTKRPERMRDYVSGLTFERLVDCANLNAWGEKHGPGAYNLTSINHLSHKRRWMDGDRTVWARLPKPPLPNVWLGVSVENQAAAGERIPLLLQTPAAVRFLSCEPLLGPVDLTRISLPEPRLYADGGAASDTAAPMRTWPRLNWVIVGGESGPGARPMHPAWARELRDQCIAARVPYFFKQWGEYRGIDGVETADGGTRFDPPLGLEGLEGLRRWDGDVVRRGAPGELAKHFLRPGTFAVKMGKKAAGRLLDGVEWSQFPEVAR